MLAMRFFRLYAGPLRAVSVLLVAACLGPSATRAEVEIPADSKPAIRICDPPEHDFFSKVLDFHGIPIKAPKVVVDEALYAAYDRLALQLKNLPVVTANLAAAGAELHIIGRDQVTTDLPEWRRDKGRHLPEYNGLTRDERTRGMGGLLTSCGEENLLMLEQDHYRGRDICLHEFAHNIRNHGIQRELRVKFMEQYRQSLDKGRWEKSYAATNPDEYFAELTMWYFGTHGDLHMTGEQPKNGPEGLKAYDPDAFALFDDFYSGRLEVTRLDPRKRRIFEEGDSDDDPDERSPAANKPHAGSSP